MAISSILRAKAASCAPRQHSRNSVASGRPAGRRCLQCRAAMNSGPEASETVEAVKQHLDRFFKRYDVLSSGMGALVVTSYCVYRGQDPATAFSITVASTVVALVLNEFMSSNDC